MPSPADVSSIVRSTPAGAGATAINATLFTVAAWDSLGGIFLALWCAVTVTIAGTIIMMSWRVRDRVGSRPSRRAKRKLQMTSLALALPWAVLAVALVPMGNERDRLLGLIVCAGQISGGAIMLQRVFSAALVYVGTIVTGVALGCLLSPSLHTVALVIFNTLNAAFISFSAYVNGRVARERDRAMQRLTQSHEALQDANRRITAFAYEDPVTGLGNRKAFTEALDGILAGQGPTHRHVLLVFDLDNFKNVNDTMGHPVGDALLKEMGRRILETVGPTGVVARTGGDEFSAVVRTNDVACLTELADALVAALAVPVELGGHWINPGATIGLALLPDHGTTAEVLVQRAEAALARAKEGGKGRWMLFDEGLEAQLADRRVIAAALERGDDDTGLAVHYQPKVDLVTGEVLGAEALVRWTHPDLGPVGPDRLLSVAAERARMQALSARIFDRVGQDILTLRARGIRPGRVAVNIHPADLKTPERLLDSVRRLKSRGIGPDDLSLEITEGCFVGRGTEQAPMVLDTLAEMGYRLSLDDFGTGFAAMTHLRSLPVSEIKIDRGFVAGITETASDRAIVSATIAIAREMGLVSVAEGVEREDQRAMLEGMGALQGQGYLWAPPLPLENFVGYIAESAARITPLRPAGQG